MKFSTIGCVFDRLGDWDDLQIDQHVNLHVGIKIQCGGISELNFHIWNANSQSFAWAKSEAKMAAHVENFGHQFQSSALMYVSSRPLHDFNLQFVFGSVSKTLSTMKKVLRRNTAGLVLHYRVFKKIHCSHVA